jgi:hypothetical protein
MTRRRVRFWPDPIELGFLIRIKTQPSLGAVFETHNG